jgi:ketosteroid isomerase-like protein
MTIANPQDINSAFADAYNNQDIQAALGLYEEKAQLGRLDGTIAIGYDEIEAELRNLHSIGGTMTSVNAFTVVQGDIALLRANWTIEVNQDGQPRRITGSSSEVVRQQPDGTWRYTIDYPLGSS